MTRKGTHDQGTTNGHPLLGRPRDNQRTPRDTPRTDPSETAPFQRSDQGTTNGQPTDSTRCPTKGQISPLYRGRLSPGHEFRNTHNNPKPATQKEESNPKKPLVTAIAACPGQMGTRPAGVWAGW